MFHGMLWHSYFEQHSTGAAWSVSRVLFGFRVESAPFQCARVANDGPLSLLSVNVSAHLLLPHPDRHAAFGTDRRSMLKTLGFTYASPLQYARMKLTARDRSRSGTSFPRSRLLGVHPRALTIIARDAAPTQ